MNGHKIRIHKENVNKFASVKIKILLPKENQQSKLNKSKTKNFPLRIKKVN